MQTEILKRAVLDQIKQNFPNVNSVSIDFKTLTKTFHQNDGTTVETIIPASDEKALMSIVKPILGVSELRNVFIDVTTDKIGIEGIIKGKEQRIFF